MSQGSAAVDSLAMSESRRSDEPAEDKISLYKSWFDASNAKAAKGTPLGYLNGIHYMSPATSGGAKVNGKTLNVCKWAARCVQPCLTSSGKGGAANVIKGRISRTNKYARSLEKDGGRSYCALHQLAIDNPRSDKSLVAVAERLGLEPVLRLNGTSDIRYEELGILHDNPTLAKYDYTKDWEKYLDWLDGRLESGRSPQGKPTYFRSNGSGHFKGLRKYHLTLSLGGTLDAKPDASRIYQEVLDRGGSIAAVWVTEAQANLAMSRGCHKFVITNHNGEPVNEIYLGKRRKVVDGNYVNGDIRFLDEPGVIVGLYAKGYTHMKDAGRSWLVQCPQCKSMGRSTVEDAPPSRQIFWSGDPRQKPTCKICTTEMYGTAKGHKYFTFKPTSKRKINREGKQFFLNERRSSRPSMRDEGEGVVYDSLALGQIKQQDHISIDCLG